MRSSLTLLHETLSHFPVLGGGVGLMCFVGSCATSSLNVSLSSKSSWLPTFFNSNLINCPLVSFLRSFSPYLYYSHISLSPFFPYLYYMVLSLSPFWVESLYPYSYPYYMVLFLSPFWVTIWSSISILYGLVFKSFWVESLCSYPYVYTIVTFL